MFGTSFCGKCGGKFVNDEEGSSSSLRKSLGDKDQGEVKSKKFRTMIVAGFVLLLLSSLIYTMLGILTINL